MEVLSMTTKRILISLSALTCLICLFPEISNASVESSLSGIQTKLTHVILPTISIIGIAWAAFSMMSGNERAKMHMWYAILGSIIGFGAQSIVDFISQTVR
jgi:type IV secretory pathway VirB2 component (pilin)